MIRVGSNVAVRKNTPPRPPPRPSRLGDVRIGFLWLVSNVSPILLANIVVYLDWDLLAAKPIPAVALRAGNPVVLAGGVVDVVGLEATADDAAEAMIAIEYSSAGAIEGNATNASRT